MKTVDEEHSMKKFVTKWYRTWLIALLATFIISCGLFRPIGAPPPPRGGPQPPAPPNFCGLVVPPNPGLNAGVETLDTDDGDEGIISKTRLVLNAATNIEIESNLQLISNQSFKIEGKIYFKQDADETYNLTIVSWAGDIHITNTSGIGGGFLKAADSGDNGDPGKPGGKIVIIAANDITIESPINANRGGLGGKGVQHRPLASNANSIGGLGGAGGEVIICAGGNIFVRSPIVGGRGGGGGEADAKEDSGDPVAATGGKAGKGGNVEFKGHRAANVDLHVNADINAGGAGKGGDASAEGSDPAGTGASGSGVASVATAKGGDGDLGGDIKLANVNVIMGPQKTVNGGDGGSGGDAEAKGGYGRDTALFLGSPVTPGGNATAMGGGGKKGGAEPRDPISSVALGDEGRSGAGGKATAAAGRGGIALASAIGGASGIGNATGGKNGDGDPSPDGTDTTAAVTSSTSSGGANRTARSRGAPQP